MPRPATNWLGQRVDRVEVLSRAGSTPRGRALWHCRCDCGRTCVLKSGQLARGCAACPECQARDRKAIRVDLSKHPPFGRLAAIRSLGPVGSNIVWECRCECGKLTRVRYPNLISGATQSCGCLHAEQAAQNVVAARATTRAESFRCAICQRMVQGKKSPRHKYCSPDCKRVRDAAARHAAERGTPEQQAAALAAQLENRT